MRILPIIATVLPAFALAACGVQEDLPMEAIAPDTAMVMRLPPDGMSSAKLRESLEAFADIAGKSSNPQIVQLSGIARLQSMSIEGEDAAGADAQMKSLSDAGVKAIWIVLRESALSEAAASAGDAASGDLDALSDAGLLVVQSGSRDSGPAIETAMRAMDESLAKCTVSPVAPGWFHVNPDGSSAIPERGDATLAGNFGKALKAQPQGSIAIALRMTDSMRAALSSDDEMVMQAQMMAGGMVDALKDMQMATLSAALGKDPSIMASMTFASAAKAEEFNTAWQGALQAVQGIVQMQAMMEGMEEDGDDGDEPKAKGPDWSPIFEGLRMKQDAQRLSLVIDRAAMSKMMR